MRVEKFSLFFPPTLLSKKVGETEYAIGAIPAGGYVKISGMNPDEDLPEEVRDRAYHAQPVWKRIVVIAAGPAVNLVLAFLLLFVFFFAIGPRDDHRRGGGREGLPGRRRAQARRQARSAVDGETRRRRRSSRTQIATHRCAAAPADGGLQGGHAGQLTGRSATASAEQITAHADLRPDGQAHAARASLRGAARARRSPFGRAGRPRPSTASGSSPSRPWSCPARLFDPEQRKEISGIVGSYEVTRQTILNDARRGGRHPGDHLAVAGDREPVPVPAARRRAHLLGDRREGARASRCPFA